jgi:hypothetical protein
MPHIALGMLHAACGGLHVARCRLRVVFGTQTLCCVAQARPHQRRTRAGELFLAIRHPYNLTVAVHMFGPPPARARSSRRCKACSSRSCACRTWATGSIVRPPPPAHALRSPPAAPSPRICSRALRALCAHVRRCALAHDACRPLHCHPALAACPRRRARPRDAQDVRASAPVVAHAVKASPLGLPPMLGAASGQRCS